MLANGLPLTLRHPYRWYWSRHRTPSTCVRVRVCALLARDLSTDTYQNLGRGPDTHGSADATTDLHINMDDRMRINMAHEGSHMYANLQCVDEAGHMRPIISLFAFNMNLDNIVVVVRTEVQAISMASAKKAI